MVVAAPGALDANVWQTELEVVVRPVVEHGSGTGVLFAYGVIREEYARVVTGDKDEDVPDAVEVWEVDLRPGLAKQAVVGPAEHGQPPYDSGSDTQTLHPSIISSGNKIVRRTRSCRGGRSAEVPVGFNSQHDYGRYSQRHECEGVDHGLHNRQSGENAGDDQHNIGKHSPTKQIVKKVDGSWWKIGNLS